MADLALISARPRNAAPLMVIVLWLGGFSLLAVNMAGTGQLFLLTSLLQRARADDLAALRLLYDILPRAVVALAAGGLLGLSAALMRQALQNPLAEPGTLGLLSAARLSVAVSLIWFPALAGLQLPVLAGCTVAALLVLGLSACRGFSPLFVVLNGMILGLCLDAATSMLLLTHFEELGELVIWQSGSLAQDNWRAASMLSGCLALAAGATFLLRRPIGWLDLGEASMRGVGLSPSRVRALAFVLAILAAAAVTMETGIIAFVGLAGAALASALGSRHFPARAGFSALIGGGLLLVTDQAVQMVEMVLPVPAGTVTALFAAPVLLALLRKGRILARQGGAVARAIGRTRPSPRSARLVLPLLCGLTVLCLLVGRVPNGFSLAVGPDWLALIDLRWPRVLAAAATGGLLAVAGTLMQRMTANELASPELLGVSSGAALMMLPIVLLLPPLDRSQTMLIASLGSLIALMLSLRLSARSGFAPERLLLSGLAITALASSLLSVIAFLGDPRLVRLLGWLSGSTYRVRPEDALLATAMLLVVLAVTPLLGRWLALLPLGDATASALGLRPRSARLALILLTAVATGTATVMIGPISFIGLIAPHLARLFGLRTPLAQVSGAVVFGAAMLMLADWLGRIAAFPWELPAGLVVTVIGALCYGLLMGRR